MCMCCTFMPASYVGAHICRLAYVHRSIHPSIHLFIHPCTHALTPKFFRSRLHAFVRSAIDSFIRSFIDSVIDSFIDSFVQSFLPSFIHSFNDSLNPSCRQAGTRAVCPQHFALADLVCACASPCRFKHAHLPLQIFACVGHLVLHAWEATARTG